jgi:hypothetical protein
VINLQDLLSESAQNRAQLVLAPITTSLPGSAFGAETQGLQGRMRAASDDGKMSRDSIGAWQQPSTHPPTQPSKAA